VVGALGEAGDGGGAEDACAKDCDGKTAAVDGIVGCREGIFFGESGFVELEF